MTKIKRPLTSKEFDEFCRKWDAAQTRRWERESNELAKSNGLDSGFWIQWRMKSESAWNRAQTGKPKSGTSIAR